MLFTDTCSNFLEILQNSSFYSQQTTYMSIIWQIIILVLTPSPLNFEMDSSVWYWTHPLLQIGVSVKIINDSVDPDEMAHDEPS